MRATSVAEIAVVTLVAVAAPARAAPRWIAGDLHVHESPPDAPRDVAMSADEIAEAARARGLEFVILTPHLWETRWHAPAARRRFLAQWKALARTARWTRGARGFAAQDGVEVWNAPLALANLVSQPRGASGEDLAFVAAVDAQVHTFRIVQGASRSGFVYANLTP